MPPLSKTKLGVLQSKPTIAQFLRGGERFGLVAFHETPGQLAVADEPGDGHADCLPSWRWMGTWSWRDPETLGAGARVESQS